MRPILASLLLLSAFFPPPALGEEEALGRAVELRGKGRYSDAEAVLRKALAAHPKDPALAAEAAELYLETGRYADAERVARSVAKDPRCLTLAGESLLLRGALEAARQAAGGALALDPEFPRARFLLARVQRESGDREGARKAYRWFFDYYAGNDVQDPEALTLIALASLRLAELSPDVQMSFRPTIKILDGLTGVPKLGIPGRAEDYLPAYVAKAEIFLAVYQDKDAKKWLRAALAKNPRYPPALVGLARQMAFVWQSVAGVAKCEEALLVNPSLAEAHEFIAEVRIGDRRYEDAEKHLEQVLSVNPRSRRSRGLLAVIRLLKGDRTAFEAQAAELLKEDPKDARVFLDLTGALEQQRRFAEAARWAQRAVDTDGDDFRAWWMLGRNLVHLAREKEALEALRKSRELDPGAHYWGNPFRENMIEVLGHLKEFDESRTEHFRLRIHVGENAVLSRYYARFLEASYRQLTKKYGFTPEGPILTEVFHRHDDFAARTVGLPGIGALGACFGKVVTLDSPSARPPGQFIWASTAHHEFAHVITLQLSKGRVPRWLTEGLSVYEEREYADWWERDQERALFDKWANGEIYPILDFNAVFRTREVGFAYYLGGRMCEFLSEAFGFASIVEMLKAYARNLATPAVLKEVLGVTPEEYDRRFREWVGREVGGYRLVPNWSNRTLGRLRARAEENPRDAEACSRIAWAWFQRGNTIDAMTWLGKAWALDRNRPELVLLRGRAAFTAGRHDQARKWYGEFLKTGGDDFQARLDLAALEEKEGRFEEAMTHLRAAKACFPPSPRPFLELARLLKGEGDLEGAVRELEGAARRRGKDIAIRLELADYYEEKEDDAALARILNEVVFIYPLALDARSGLSIHARLADARRRLADYAGAALEYEVALELGVPRAAEPEIRTSLGETYRLLGRIEDARFQAQSALDLDPSSVRARELLEKCRNP